MNGSANKRAAWLSGWLAIAAMLGAGPAHAADKLDAKATKMGVYVRMLNAWVNTVDEQRTSFFDTVDKKTGITCKESSIRMLRVAPVAQPGEDLTVKDLPKFRA